MTKADAEKLARSVVEDQFSNLEKEKIMKELEISDMMMRHQQELSDKEATISSVRSAQVLFVRAKKCLLAVWMKSLPAVATFFCNLSPSQKILTLLYTTGCS